jgi:hypothetical protein
MSYAIREKMIPYLGKRVVVRGVLGKWGDWIRNYRDVGRVGIQSPEINCEVVADYVWVTDVPHWSHLKDKAGHQVEFEAVVSKYRQSSDSQVNYCLTSAGNPTLLHPLSLSIPDMPSEEEEPTQPNEPEMDESMSESIPASRDAIQDWREAKAFAKACGTPVKALEVLDKLPDMPRTQLKEYLGVLSEE